MSTLSSAHPAYPAAATQIARMLAADTNPSMMRLHLECTVTLHVAEQRGIGLEFD